MDLGQVEREKARAPKERGGQAKPKGPGEQEPWAGELESGL